MSEHVRPARDHFSWVPADFDLERELHLAVDRGEMLAYFQPQWDAWTSELVAVEALCRWHHPQIGIIAPSVFIALAEDTGAMQSIGDFMIDAACDLAQDLLRRDLALDVSLNMSAVQLDSSQSCDRVVERISSLGLDPARLTVEITESVRIDDVPHAVELLSALRDLGVGISIDDFGSGHSSTSQVLALPVTEVKLDRSLIDRPVDESRELVRSAVALAKRESLRVVAEGVETGEQLDLVRSEGCDRVQGFLLGRPKPRPAIDEVFAPA